MKKYGAVVICGVVMAAGVLADQMAVHIKDGREERVEKGLVAHYPFDGDAADVSGHGYDGQVFRATPTEDGSGKPQAAYLFDGKTSCVSLPAAVLNNLQSGSFLVLIRMDSYTQKPSVPIVSKGTSDLCDFMIAVNEDGSCVAHMGTSLYLTSPKAAIPLGQWIAVALTWDGARWQMYINGALSASAQTDAIPHADADNAVKMGRHDHASGPFFFSGAMNDVRVYDRALRPEEIRTVQHCAP